MAGYMEHGYKIELGQFDREELVLYLLLQGMC